MKLLLLLCAALVTCVAAQSLSCSAGYTLHSGKCLLYINSFVSYDQAVTSCSNQGDGWLVKIRNLEDDNAVRSFVDTGGNIYNVWLPVVDTNLDGVFNYDDGSPLTTYSPWNSVPDITTQKGCAIIMESNGGLAWFSFNCASVAYAVCEVQPVEAPPCGYGWTHNPDDNTCLRAIRSRRRTYTRASAYCQSLEGKLARNVFKFSQRRRITKLVKFRAHFFIGLDDVDNNGIYQYQDGSNMEANPPFKRGTPGSGRCVTINKRRWFAKDCYKPHFFVCEKDLATTP